MSVIILSVEGAYRAIRRRERFAENKQALAVLILKAHEIKDSCANTHSRLPHEEIEAWTMEIKTVLEKLGPSYLNDFTKPLAGPKATTIIETNGTVQEIIPCRDHYDQWNLLSHRMKRLEQYLTDLSLAENAVSIPSSWTF